ncbi:MAG: outer membrane protein assembly factor BamA [Gammaproteobacteria bacterium]|jgi:outer membrane protein insertion porin family
MSSRRLLLVLTAILLAGFAVQATAQSGFVVRDMRVEGLQRISEGTVFNYLPVSVGDTVDTVRVEEAMRALYGTGLFQDVEFRRDGGTLVIAVRERPSIKSFTISGNKDIETEDLEDSLRQVGLATGKTFNRSVLENVRQILTEQYYSQGKYSVIIDADVREEDDNTVSIAIDIKEGERARIRQINVVGNTAFDDEELLEAFQLKTPNWLSFYRQDDRYAREALLGDLETLRSFYMDRGYAAFEIVSTQVAISPDRQNIYITVNIAEGEPFVITDIELAGDLVVPEQQLQALVLAKPGQTFSRRLLTQTADLISYRLGEEGYAFARVEPVPDIDAENQEVSVTFYVDPGKRAYVRRIAFEGVSSIQDQVLRREMRQMEGAFLSNRAVERSEQRIRRLPFIEEVATETKPVSGSDDLVDVDFSITEGQPGTFGGGLGYSASQGVLLNGNFVHTNFLGTGNRIEADINTSEYITVYRALYTNPYVTPDGVSRTISLSYRDVTQFTSGASDFDTQTWTFGMEWGYPISEYSRIRFGFAVADTELSAGDGSSLQAREWVGRNGNPSLEIIELENGNEVIFTKSDFISYELLAGWIYDSRNRAMFADRGARQSLAFAVTGPGSEVQYFTSRFNYTKYWPIRGQWALKLAGDWAYAQELGDTTATPPYKRYFGGGPNSVRGFKEGRLGPRDSLNNPYGGNILIANQLELVVPIPEQWQNKGRLSLFFDSGNVFSDDGTSFFELDEEGNVYKADYSFDISDMRYSTGIAAEWLSPLGVFRFSYGFPLNDEAEDETENFQFSIGSAF